MGIVNEDIIECLLRNTNKQINQFICWYFKQIGNSEWQLIITTQEHAEYLMQIVRDKSNTITPEGNSAIEYDKALKAEQYRHECWKNSIEAMKELKELAERYEMKFNKVHSILKSEVSSELLQEMGVPERKSLEYKDYLEN